MRTSAPSTGSADAHAAPIAVGFGGVDPGEVDVGDRERLGHPVGRVDRGVRSERRHGMQRLGGHRCTGAEHESQRSQPGMAPP